MKNGTLTQYEDLLANVRYDGRFHSIRDLVQPHDPLVMELADVVSQDPDFIEAAQEFVDSFTTYEEEIGDYWAYPWETLALRAGDCDDKAILLCSILRNYIPAEKVFCAIGTWTRNGNPGGHMWLVTQGNRKDRTIEATAPPGRTPSGTYRLSAIFNDEYAFAYPEALQEFGLLPFEAVINALEEAGAILR
jgi:transglutaminase-like putative cysteine protease